LLSEIKFYLLIAACIIGVICQSELIFL